MTTMPPTAERRGPAAQGRLNPFVRDVGTTTVTGLLVTLSSLAVVSLVGRWMGAMAVGEYLLLRRVGTWLGSGAQLGIGVALPRYVATTADQEESTQLCYLIGAIGCLLAFSTGLALVLIAARPVFAKWFFGSSELAVLILPLGLILVGQSLHVSVYGYYRGRLWMHWANGLQAINMALLPILTVLLFFRSHSVAFIVAINGACMLVISALFVLPISRELVQIHLPRLWPHVNRLLRYGLARVPGDFALNALFALGPVIASHYLPVSKVSQLLFGLGILVAISMGVLPCGIVLLAKISTMLARGQIHEVRSRLGLFAAAILETSVFVSLQVVVFADVLMRIWLGAGYMEGVQVVRLVVLSIPAYVFFVAMRSAIDAATVVAHNAHSVYVALAVFVAFSVVAVRFCSLPFLLHGIAVAIVLGNTVLAWRTTRIAKDLLGVCVPWKESTVPLLLAFFLGVVSYGIHRWIGPEVGLLSLAMVQLAMAAIFFGALLKLGSSWLLDFWRLIQPAREANAHAR